MTGFTRRPRWRAGLCRGWQSTIRPRCCSSRAQANRICTGACGYSCRQTSGSVVGVRGGGVARARGAADRGCTRQRRGNRAVSSANWRSACGNRAPRSRTRAGHLVGRFDIAGRWLRIWRGRRQGVALRCPRARRLRTVCGGRCGDGETALAPRFSGDSRRAARLECGGIVLWQAGHFTDRRAWTSW